MLVLYRMTTAREEFSKPGPKPRPALEPRDIQGLKYFNLIQDLLERLHEHKDCHNRKLHYDEYASLLMLHFLNPVLTSLGSIQQASGLRNVQKKMGVKRASMGSLSEAQHVFDPALLGEVFQELAGQTVAADAAKRPRGLSEELDVVAQDGTMLRALPRMVWALWQDEEHRGIKVHLEFDVLRSVPKAAPVTEANASEIGVLRENLTSGKVYLMDAGYVEYALYEEIRQAKSSFVARLHENAAYDIVQERDLSPDDEAAGVTFDRVVRLGSRPTQGDLSAPVRLVQVHVKNPPQRGLARRRSKVSSKKTFRHRPEEYDLLLATDLMDLPAEVVAVLFRYRWTIELFFRWFKCVLGFSHLICESREGVQIIVYCALIVSLLITLWTGRKPTKRTLEMIQLYFQGWAELDELEAHIEGLKKVAD